MEVEIINQSKDLMELKVDNVTVAEVIRVYLNEQGVKFAAWRRKHPTEPVIFRIESDKVTAKKAISDAISAINKDMGKISKLVK